jgi:hypothetical protein
MAGAAVPRAGSLLEIREYTLHPAGVKDYLALTAQTAELRGRLLPFLGCVFDGAMALSLLVVKG